MIAFVFFSTSSSVMVGLERAGGAGALSRLARRKQGKNITPLVCASYIYFSLHFVKFCTWEVFAWTGVPATSVPASSVSTSLFWTSPVFAASVSTSSVPIIGHAGDTAHRLIWGSAVSAPSTSLLRLSAEASLGDLVPVTSLAASKSVEATSVVVAPVSVTFPLTTGA